MKKPNKTKVKKFLEKKPKLPKKFEEFLKCSQN